MDALEAEAAYRSARSRLDACQITLHEYNTLIAQLLYRDNTGTWWAISPADGSWLKWDGSAWVPGFSQPVPGTPRGLSRQIPLPQAQPVRTEPSSEAGPQPGPLAAAGADVPPSSSILSADLTGQPAGFPPSTTGALPAEAGIAGFIRHGAGIAGVLLGIGSWIVYPYLLGLLAIVAGGYALVSARKTTKRLPLPAVAAIIIALASMLLSSVPIGL